MEELLKIVKLQNELIDELKKNKELKSKTINLLERKVTILEEKIMLLEEIISKYSSTGSDYDFDINKMHNSCVLVTGVSLDAAKNGHF